MWPRFNCSKSKSTRSAGKRGRTTRGVCQRPTYLSIPSLCPYPDRQTKRGRWFWALQLQWNVCAEVNEGPPNVCAEVNKGPPKKYMKYQSKGQFCRTGQKVMNIFLYTFIGEIPWLGHCRNMLLETNNCCRVFGNVVFENVDLLIGEILRSKFMMKCRVFENVELLIIEICCWKLITIVEFSKM